MKTITTAVAMTARRQRQLSQLIPMDARDAFEIINELHFYKQKLVGNCARQRNASNNLPSPPPPLKTHQRPHSTSHMRNF